MGIPENLSNIRERIGECAAKVQRHPSEITLVAVTKYVGVAEMNAALRAGVSDIGENRVQDGIAKFPLLERSVTRHLIGSLQTNKVKGALTYFDLIHSVDRPELVQELTKHAKPMGKKVKLLIQLNISGEISKHGLAPAKLFDLLKMIREADTLIPAGLMTIAPLTENAESSRPVFRRLKELFEEVAVKYPSSDWRYLSMGMSQDFEIAVEEGANIVRIGTAIFR